MLSFGVSIGESCDVSLEKLHEMELFLSSFVDDFPYHERYNWYARINGPLSILRLSFSNCNVYT